MALGDDSAPAFGPQSDDHAREQVALLYRDRASALRRRLRARVGSTDEANEILHDAFARLLGAHPFSRVRDPDAFLNRIVCNLLIDRSRRRGTRPAHVAIDDHPNLAIAPDQGQAIELEQMRARYRQVLASLPPRMREVFVLHRVEGLSYKEIAERLDISVRTVECLDMRRRL
jgi:RNA polymerase sigma factor (sigma-70 family)